MEDEPRRLLLVVAIVLLALGVRWWGLESQSLTMDEIADIGSASGSLSSVIHTRDGFPPLYGTLVHAWLSVIPGEANVRWLSLILGVLSVAAMQRLGAWAGGERVGRFAALALAVSPFHCWISQEARAGALYVLCAVVALWLFFRAMSTNRRRDWLLYALACVAGLYSHYYFALLPLIAGGVALFEKRTAAERMPIVLANAALAIASLPLVGLLRADLAYQSGYKLDAPFNVATMGYAYFSIVAGFDVGPSLRELHSLSTSAAVLLMLPWAVAVAIALLVLGYLAIVTLGTRPIFTRLVVLATAPVAVGGTVGEIMGTGFRVRYFAWVVIPVLVLVAAGLSSFRWRAARLAAAGTLLIVSAISIVDRVRVERYWNEDVAALGTFLRATSAPSVPVFVTAKYMAVPVEHYLGAGWTVCALPDVNDDSRGTDGALRVVRTVTPPGSAFWLVYTRPFHSDPAGRLPLDLMRLGLIRSRREFAGITVYQGNTTGAPPSVPPLGCQDPNPTDGTGTRARRD
jgi:4-amino-4-deoxy-L-arabinose transferase-like glycosyltransferase